MWNFSTLAGRQLPALACRFDTDFRRGVSTTVGLGDTGFTLLGADLRVVISEPLPIELVAVRALNAGAGSESLEIITVDGQQPERVTWQIAIPFADGLDAHLEQVAAEVTGQVADG